MKIYDANESSFLTNGYGAIDPIKCIEVKKKSLNGWYLDVEVQTKDSDKVLKNRILYVETKEKGGQPFRIGDLTKTEKKISFTANHIVFDCEGYLLDDVRPTELSAPSFLSYINGRTDTESPFIVNSNIAESNTAYFIRKSLLEAFKTAEELFGGVYDIDAYNVNLKDHVGKQSDVSFVYGKNIEGMTASEDWSGVCTKLLPEGPNELLLPEKYITTDIEYGVPYTRTVTFSIEAKKEDGTEKTQEEMISEMRALAKEYVEKNKYPRVNYTVKSNVEQSLGIGDIISIKHPIASIETEVLSYEYDVIYKKMKTLEFGNYTQDVKTFFQDFKNSIENVRTLSKDQTDLINRLNKEGLVYIDDNEVLILDKKPKESAKNVWRFGLGGIGFSSNGYQGPFDLAMTMDGKINASMILTGILKAINIEGVTIAGSKVICDDGEIAGFDLSSSGFEKSETLQLKKIYVKADADRVRNIIMGEIVPNETDFFYYDVNENGKIDSMDYVMIQYLISLNSDKLISSIVINAKSFSVNDIKFPTILIQHTGDGGTIAAKTSINARGITTPFGNFERIGSDLLAVDSIYTNSPNKQAIDVYFDIDMKSHRILNQSDKRLKENINDVNLEPLFDMANIKSFDFINGPSNCIGAIAQDFVGTEYEKYLVSECETNDGKRYGLNYNVLFLANIQKTKQLEKRIEELERRVMNK